MSILASGFPNFGVDSLLAATTMPAGGDDVIRPAEVLFFAGALTVALVLAVVTRVFVPSRVDGPLRIPVDRPLWPLAVGIGIGVFVWIGSQTLYTAYRQLTQMRQAGSGGADLPTTMPALRLTIADIAVLSTVPAMVGFAWLFFADRQLVRISQLQLGFTRQRFADGVAKGLLACGMILPAMLVAMLLVEMLYTRLHYKHPAEHELLRVMSEAHRPLLRWVLIAGATLAAPFFEEYLFRGFLQTFLRQSLIRWSMSLRQLMATASDQAVPAPAAMPTTPLSYFGPAPLAGYAPPAPPQGRRIWQTWTPILITALLFGSIHETWSAPLIFLLAIFLGYAYERTGTLWTPITIHLVFNATMTVMSFLTKQHTV